LPAAHPERAYALTLAASVFFALMGALVKGLRHLPVADSVCGRSLVIVAGAFLVLRLRGLPFAPVNRRDLCLRSLFGAIALFAYFEAVQRVPLATAVLLLKTSPLWVALFGALLLGEAIDRWTVAGLLCGLPGVGLLCLAAGPLDIAGGGAGAGLAIGLLAGMTSGLAHTLVRKLAATDPPETIVLTFALFAAACSLPVCLAARWGGGAPLPAPRDLALLFCVGIAGILAQLLLTTAYRHAQAAAVALGSLAQVLFMGILGALCFDEVPTWHTALGGLLVLAGGVVKTFAGAKANAG
jgi:drug/metabolite transporter (DMT)-like permease